MDQSIIHIFNETDSPSAGISSGKFSACVEAITSDFDQSIRSVNIILLNNDPHTEMNRNYLQHDFDTDVITFDLTEDHSEGLNGEVYINHDMAENNARTHGVTKENELHRLAIHGILHLVGMDDASEEEQAKMREKEDYYLNRFM